MKRNFEVFCGVPDRVIDAPIPQDLQADLRDCAGWQNGSYIRRLIHRIARLEAEKQDAWTEGWNAAIEAACDKADFGMIAPEDVRALSKPTAAKQGDPS